MRTWVWTCTLTLSVAPSIGIGILVASAAGASSREVARTAFRVAFIGDPFRQCRCCNEEAGALGEKAASCGGTLRKTGARLQIDCPRRSRDVAGLLHVPARGDDHGLARQRVPGGSSEEQREPAAIPARGGIARHPRPP